MHEFSHASAAWLTCGKVKKIEVYNNEAGIAGFSGGWRPCVVPAGYVGGAYVCHSLAAHGQGPGGVVAGDLLTTRCVEQHAIMVVTRKEWGVSQSVLYFSAFDLNSQY